MKIKKEKPILFSTPMVQGVLDGRKTTTHIKKLYSSPLLSECDPQHLANRIMNRIKEIDSNGCWIWGGTLSAGYGCMTILKKSKRVHQVSWSITRGKLIPSGMCVCHKCDNRKCVNPEHLFLGTHSENMKDCYEKGRSKLRNQSFPKDSNPSAKLNQNDVDNIREMLNVGKTQKAIANTYHISQSQVSNIKRGIRW